MKTSKLRICSFIFVVFLVMITGISRAEDTNVSFVGHIGGSISDVTVAGNYAYVGEGQDFVVLDITDVNNPIEVGKITTPELLNDIAISGDYAYVTENVSLVILDISDPSSPRNIGSYRLTNSLAGSVTVSGDHAYVSCLAGFMVLDVSNPSTPTLVGRYTYTTSPASYTSNIIISGNYAYVPFGDFGLHIVDISNPSSPTRISISSTQVGRVAISGNYAYATRGDNGLVIINISNLSSPTLVGNYNPTDANPNDIVVSGNYAYIANANSGDNGLTVLDVTNVSSPKLVGKCNTGNSRYVTLSGNQAYVINSQTGLAIVDIADASSPKLLSSFNSIGAVIDVAVSGNYAFVGDTYNGLVIIDITNTSSPKIACRCPIGSPVSGLAVSDNYAYLVCENSSLVIVDISNPSSPKFVSSCYTGFSSGGFVVLAGNYAYVAYSMGLAIIDISNPLSPRLAGSYHDARYSASGLAVAGNYAYVADRDGGFIVIDITNPSLPKFVCKYNPGTSWSNDIAVEGNYAYIASDNDLWVVDITDSSSPIFKGKLGVSAEGIHLSGKYAYVTSLFSGLYVVDITNVSSTTIVAHYGTAGVSYRSYVKGDYVYVADERNGIVILKTDLQNQVLEPPVANFTSNVVEGHIPLSVQFTDLSENATNWEWQFGDGVIALGQKNPVHVYDYAGVYNVTLKVTNAAGSNNTTKTSYINVTVDENEVLKSKLVEKVKKQIVAMEKNDPKQFYDKKSVEKYMKTLGGSRKVEFYTYLNNVEIYQNAQSQMLQDALIQANKGDEAKVERDLNLALHYGQNAATSFQNAMGLYNSILNHWYFVAKETQTVSVVAFQIVGAASGVPFPTGFLQVIDYGVLAFDDLYIEDKSLGTTITDVAKQAAFKYVINTVKIPALGDKTITECYADPTIWNSKLSDDVYLEMCRALKSSAATEAVYNELRKESAGITAQVVSDAWNLAIDQTEKDSTSKFYYQAINIESPGELRVYDSNGNVTGLVNGKIVQNIPYSVYDAESEKVIILQPTDTYRYEIVGTATGEYGFKILSAGNEAYNTLHLKNNVTLGEVHQYTVDWNSIATEKAVTLNIDSNGDGTFDKNIKMQLPTASFADTRLTNQHISFDGSSSEGNIVSYKWDFGDGTSGDGKTVDHIYPNEGDYVVTLTVEDDNGGIDSRTRNIRIDLTSPTTAANISGTLGNNNFYTSEIQVNLTATDNINGSGVNKTEYSFDNVNWNTYNDSVTIKDQGTTTLYYRSIDNAGNTELTNAEDLKLDFVVPKIQSATIFPANTTAGSKIDISANITDNIGVAEVTAGDVQLMSISGSWLGNIIAPSSIGKYSLSINASDAAGNTANVSVPYSVVRRKGGINVAVLPTVSKVIAGKNTTVAVKVKNNQNIDDTFKIQIRVNGIPAFNRAGDSWFSWTEKTVNLRAKQEVLIPIEVTVPTGTVSGLKVFKVSVNSEKYSVHGSDTGSLVISRPPKNINKQIGPKGPWSSR